MPQDDYHYHVVGRAALERMATRLYVSSLKLLACPRRQTGAAASIHLRSSLPNSLSQPEKQDHANVLGVPLPQEAGVEAGVRTDI